MDWIQIESKWAAMTRRVRADAPISKVDAITTTRTTTTLRRAAKVDVRPSHLAEQATSAIIDLQKTMSTR